MLFAQGIGDGFGDGRVGHAQADGEAGDLAAHVGGWHGGDDGSCRAECVDLAFWVFQPPLPALEFVVDDHVGQGMCVPGQ